MRQLGRAKVEFVLALLLGSLGCRKTRPELPPSDAAPIRATPSDGGGTIREASAPLPFPPPGVKLPHIDPRAVASSLRPDQKGVLCDWISAQLGGYGLETKCNENRTATNFQNQEECTSGYFNFPCPVTVEQVERCTVAQAPSHGCEFPKDPCAVLLCGAK